MLQVEYYLTDIFGKRFYDSCKVCISSPIGVNIVLIMSISLDHNYDTFPDGQRSADSGTSQLHV